MCATETKMVFQNKTKKTYTDIPQKPPVFSLVILVQQRIFSSPIFCALTLIDSYIESILSI